LKALKQYQKYSFYQHFLLPVTKPSGVSTAKPILQYFLKINSLPSSLKDDENLGYFFKEIEQALITKGKIVNEKPLSRAVFFREFLFLSISVISISSFCVTCGRLTQLAWRRGPDIFCIFVNFIFSILP